MKNIMTPDMTIADVQSFSYLQGLLILEGWTLMYGETGLSTNEPKPSQRSEEYSVIRRDRATPTVFNCTTANMQTDTEWENPQAGKQQMTQEGEKKEKKEK